MSCDPNFNFTIDGHEMTVIEADGVNTEPLRVEAIQIFAAQRYSFIVCRAISLCVAFSYPSLCIAAECEPGNR